MAETKDDSVLLKKTQTQLDTANAQIKLLKEEIADLENENESLGQMNDELFEEKESLKKTQSPLSLETLVNYFEQHNWGLAKSITVADLIQIRDEIKYPEKYNK